MDSKTGQSLSIQEEERDLFQEALKNYNPDAPLSAVELERNKKNKASKEYYHANKEKVVAAKKSRKAVIAREKCLQEGIPDYFAEYIQFRPNGEIHLIFQSAHELKRNLYWIKFKSEFGKEIFPTKQ